jgi:hypothetical protein
MRLHQRYLNIIKHYAAQTKNNPSPTISPHQKLLSAAATTMANYIVLTALTIGQAGKYYVILTASRTQAV